MEHKFTISATSKEEFIKVDDFVSTLPKEIYENIEKVEKPRLFEKIQVYVRQCFSEKAIIPILIDCKVIGSDNLEIRTCYKDFHVIFTVSENTKKIEYRFP